MTKHQKQFAIFAVLCGLMAIAILASNPKKDEPTLSSDGCPNPPSVFFASKVNLDIALTETVKVLKGFAEPAVIDRIPANARSAQMVAYLACQARARGDVNGGEQYMEYVRLLNDIVLGRSIAMNGVRHNGTLDSLASHFNRTTSNFVLRFSASAPKTRQLYVQEISAETWPKWFSKFCSANSSCVSCTTKDNYQTEAEIALVATPKEIIIDGARRLSC